MKYFLLYFLLLFSCRSVKLQKNFDTIKKDSSTEKNIIINNDSTTIIQTKNIEIVNPFINRTFDKKGRLLNEQIKGTILRDTEKIVSYVYKHDTVVKIKTVTNTIEKIKTINKTTKSSYGFVLYIIVGLITLSIFAFYIFKPKL